MAVAIKLSDAADYEAVARLNAEVQQLHADALPESFKPAASGTFTQLVYDAMLARPGAHLYLAVEGTEPVGYVYAQVQERPDTWARYAQRVVYIDQLVVSRRFRGLGYGKQLIQHVVALAEAHGIRRVELDTWSFNTNARAFFQRLGFTEFDVRMGRDLA